MQINQRLIHTYRSSPKAHIAEAVINGAINEHCQRISRGQNLGFCPYFLFRTGVSPVTLDDLTSGFNIGWNASTQPELDKMLDFSTADIREMFKYYKGVGMLPTDCDIEVMIEEMLKQNTKTDYSKLKKLIQLDKMDGNRKGVLMKITEEGEITADLYTYFSAEANINISNLLDAFDAMAFDGEWRDALQYMADCYKNQSSVPDSIEGERNIQGFFLAYLNLNNYYLTVPEVEVQHVEILRQGTHLHKIVMQF